MKPERISAELGDLPNMSPEQGSRMWHFLVENQLRDCLELGFFHGRSSAYIAAAIAEQGGGSLVSVDLAYVEGLQPNIHEVLDRFDLGQYVSPFLEESSYVWRLMRLLEEDPNPRFDFCYVDGAHTWFVDGFAFFLVERLLRPGGWIVFDDLDWTYAQSLGPVDTVDESALRERFPDDLVRSMLEMPEEERQTRQIRKVYELLVKPHESFVEFAEDGGWAYARKRIDARGAVPSVRREVVSVLEPRLSSKLVRRIRRAIGGGR